MENITRYYIDLNENRLKTNEERLLI